MLQLSYTVWQLPGTAKDTYRKSLGILPLTSPSDQVQIAVLCCWQSYNVDCIQIFLHIQNLHVCSDQKHPFELWCTLSTTIQQVLFALDFILSLHLSLYSSKCCFFVTLITNPLYCNLPSSKTWGGAVNTIRNQPGSAHLISEPGVTYTLWSINFLKSAVTNAYIKVIWHNYSKMLLECFVRDCRIQFYTGRHYSTSHIQMYAERHYGTSHIQLYTGRH